MCNYATKSDLKNARGFDRSQFAKKDDLPNLKLDDDDLDNDELENVRMADTVCKRKYINEMLVS